MTPVFPQFQYEFIIPTRLTQVYLYSWTLQVYQSVYVVQLWRVNYQVYPAVYG